LKGGEILKIRGLCKVHANNENIGPKHHVSDANQSSYQSYRNMENNGIKSNKSTPRNSIDKKLPDSRCASQILTQQESPVIVMTSPNQNYAQQIQQSCTQSTSNGSNQQQQRLNQQQQIQQTSQSQAANTIPNSQTSTIIVKKDVAIDPGDNKIIPVEHYGLVSLQIAAGLKKAREMRRTSNPTSGTTPMGEHRRTVSPINNFHQGDIFPNEEILGYETPSPTSFKIFNTNHSAEQLEEEALRYTEKKKRIAQNKPIMATVTSGSSRENQKNFTKYLRMENTNNQFQATVQHATKNVQIPEALNFLTIKEEPAEWTEFENDNAIPSVGSLGGTSNIGNILDNKRTEIITVKPETYDPNDTSMESDSADKVFSPLTCEICNETFTKPADWVRHIESHSESMSQNVPKKRRRVEDVKVN
jgi:hypothetical protein